MRQLQVWPVRLIIAVGLLTGCSLFTEPDDRHTNVVVARQRWLISPPQDYTFVLDRGCECLPTGPFNVSVTGATTVTATDNQGKAADYVVSLAILWDQILSAKASGDLGYARFDPQGVPLEAKLEATSTEPVFYTISRFTRTR